MHETMSMEVLERRVVVLRRVGIEHPKTALQEDRQRPVTPGEHRRRRKNWPRAADLWTPKNAARDLGWMAWSIR